MPSEISEAALDLLLARAGLRLGDAERAELREVYAGIAAMAERVRKPRGIMAEPASIFGFAEEDLG
jgi:hypothetical protein